MIGRVAIDIQKSPLIQEGGFRSPEQRLSAVCEVVQNAVLGAFGNLMPRIRGDGTGRYWYEHYDEESRETSSLARPLAPGEAWPEHEAYRLLDGWENLQRMARDQSDPHLRAFLLGMVLPDPLVQTHHYRIYEDTHGAQRLHVLWGTLSRDGRHVPLPTGQVCEMVRSGLTTAQQTLARQSMVRPAEIQTPPAPAFPFPSPSELESYPPEDTMPPPSDPPPPARDATVWLKPLAIFLAIIALLLLGSTLPTIFARFSHSNPLVPEKIHLGPENRALLGE